MTFNARTRFQEDKLAAQFHADLVTNSMFLRAVEAALLQCIADATYGEKGANEITAAANYQRIEGAKLFIDRFLGLTMADIPRRTPVSDNP